MNIPNEHILSKLFYTTIDLVLKPSKSLLLDPNSATITSKYKVSGFSYWFWTTALSVLVTILYNYFSHSTTSITFVAFNLFLYSLIRLVWVAILFYIILNISTKIKFHSNNHFNEFFNSYLFATGLATLFISFISIPMISFAGGLEHYLSNSEFDKNTENPGMLNAALSIVVISAGSLVYYYFISTSVVSNALNKKKILATVLILIIAYSLTRQVVVYMEENTRSILGDYME